MIGCSGIRSSWIDVVGDIVFIGWGLCVLDSCKIELFIVICLDWLRVNFFFEFCGECWWY